MNASAIVSYAGRRAASEWIKGQKKSELRRMEAQISNNIFASSESEDAFFTLDIDAYTAAERLYMILTDTDPSDFDRNDAAEFWGSVGDDSEPDVDFVYGFALEIID